MNASFKNMERPSVYSVSLDEVFNKYPNEVPPTYATKREAILKGLILCLGEEDTGIDGKGNNKRLLFYGNWPPKEADFYIHKYSDSENFGDVVTTKMTVRGSMKYIVRSDTKELRESK